MHIRDRIDRYRANKALRITAAIADAGPLGDLYKKAMSRYGARCFWNCTPEPTPEGMAVVADRLERYGDLRAWYLASEIKDVMTHAARPSAV